jgi:hypothetical protein
MDRNAQLRHLAAAERHVQRGERCIRDQEDCIEELGLHGHDTNLARAILETFRQIQAQHVGHRDQILKELAE